MKIAFLVHDYRRVEGHSRYVVELAERFAREHEVHVFASVIEERSNPAVRLHRIHAWKPSTLVHVLSYAVMAALEVRGRFDIIHNQGLCGPRGNVFTAHICNRAWLDSLERSGFEAGLKERFTTGLFSVLEHVFYRSLRKTNVIAVSARLARDLRERYHCRAPLTVIHHGVDLETFRPGAYPSERGAIRARHGLSDQDVVFLFVGDPRKGLDHAIAATGATPGARLLVVSRAAPPRDLPDAVCWAGPSRNVEHAHAAADALLLPTPYDAFGMVASEAMASGLPVIVSRAAGVAELIAHEKSGLLVNNPGNVAELTKHMRTLAGDPAMRAAVGAEARRVMEGRSWDSVARQTMKVYQRVLRK